MEPRTPIEVLPETDTTTFTIPDRLTIQNVAKRRAASGKLIAGVAAVADLDLFKGRGQHAHKGKAKRWDCMLSLTLTLGVPRTTADSLQIALRQNQRIEKVAR